MSKVEASTDWWAAIVGKRWRKQLNCSWKMVAQDGFEISRYTQHLRVGKNRAGLIASKLLMLPW